MPRFLGNSREQGRLRWYWGLIYPGINSGLIIIPGSILYLIFLLGMTVPSLIVVFLIMGGAIIALFSSIHGKHLGVSRGKAIQAFIYTSLISSAGYLVLSILFAKLSSII